jgi:hypothetical protein
MKKQVIIIISFLLLISSFSFAGTKAVQVESLWNGLTNTSGNPLNGGKVYTYEAGTTTAKTTWTDANKTTAAANPIILDSVGKALIFADGNYKFVIKDSSNNTLYIYDNLRYFYHDFFYARDYGDGSLTRATISAAISAISSNKGTLYLSPGDWVISDQDLTIPSNVNLKLEGGARLSISTGKTVTINGSIDAPLLQIFTWSGTGKVVFGSGSVPQAYFEWWGAIADGTTDNSSVISKAFESNCRKYQFLDISNPYYIAQSIDIPNDITLIGSHWAHTDTDNPTILYDGTNQALRTKEGFADTNNSTDIHLRDMTVKITGTGATGIHFEAAKSCEIENVIIKLNGTSQTGLRLLAERGTGTYKGNFYNFYKKMRVMGNNKSNSHTGINISGTYNDGQNNANTFVEIDIEGVNSGIVIGPSYNNRFFGVTLEHVNDKAINFQQDAQANTFSNVYLEDVITGISFAQGSGSNTVYVPFFGAGTSTAIEQGGTNNRVIGNITTWVNTATNALKQGILPADINPRSRFNADGSIAMGDGIENPVDTTSNNVGFIEPRTSLLKNYDANWENPHGTHNGSSNVNYLQDSTKNFYTYGVRTGMTVKNTTDHCTGTITSITTTTNTNDTLNFAPGGLTGGTDNDFDSGDGYTVYNTKNHPAIAVGLQGVFSKVEDIVSTEVAAKRTTDANTVNLWYRTLPEGDAYLVEAYVVAKQGDTK